MDASVLDLAEELLADLRAQVLGDARTRLAALKTYDRLEAVLLAGKAEAIVSVAKDVEDRKLREERQVGKSIFSFSIREAQLLELGPALGVSSQGAEAALSFAERFSTKDGTRNFPKLGGLLAAGEITAKTARYVGKQLGFAPAGCQAELDAWLTAQTPRWRMHSAGKIEQLMEAQYLRLDPEWCRKRRERARKARGLFIQPISDGMAALTGTLLLEEAAELREKLDAIAHTVCGNDRRPVWARHADALTILGKETALVCQCGRDTCKAAQRPVRQAKPIELVVELPALIGKAELPALLDGAPIDAELARMLAKAATRIKFTTCPEQYKPTPAVETHVNTRDGHCRFPGCYRRARTELDHTIPFDHEHPEDGGLTVPENLKRLCRHHHRAKTHGHWRDKQSPDGTVHWTSPTGQHYITTASG